MTPPVRGVGWDRWAKPLNSFYLPRPFRSSSIAKDWFLLHNFLLFLLLPSHLKLPPPIPFSPTLYPSCTMYPSCPTYLPLQHYVPLLPYAPLLHYIPLLPYLPFLPLVPLLPHVPLLPYVPLLPHVPLQLCIIPSQVHYIDFSEIVQLVLTMCGTCYGF